MLEIQNGVVVSIAISAREKEGGERRESQTAFKAVLSRSGSTPSLGLGLNWLFKKWTIL